MKLGAVALAGGVVLGLAMVDCRSPTNVIVTVSTDINCADFKGAEISVGHLSDLESTPATTTSTYCDGSGHVGTVVLVPTDAEDSDIAFRIVAGLGLDPDSCKSPGYGSGCVVVRRALRYSPHESLRVPVKLFASCNGVPCGATETCSRGQCYPATISDPTHCEGPTGCDDDTLFGPGSPAPNVSLRGTAITRAPVRRFVVDANNVYWGDRNVGSLVRAPKTSTFGDNTAATLWTSPNGANGAPNGLALDGDQVWWGSFDGGLYHVAQAGGAASQVAQLDNQTVANLTVGGNTVYFDTIVNEKDPSTAKGDIYYCSKTTGCPSSTQPPELTPSPHNPARFAVDANNVYWVWNDDSSIGHVRYCPLSQLPCTAPTELYAGNGEPWGVAVDATTVYWADYTNGTVSSCPIAGCGGKPRLIADNQAQPWAVTIDGSTLYWTTNITPGAVRKCDVNDTSDNGKCKPVDVADAQDGPWDVIVDDKFVYWVNDGSMISGLFRLPK